MLRLLSARSIASGQQSASMAGALQNRASVTQRSKFIPDSIGLVRQCDGNTRVASYPWHPKIHILVCFPYRWDLSVLGNDILGKALQGNSDLALPQGMHVNQQALHPEFLIDR